jgi:hypothetical protein
LKNDLYLIIGIDEKEISRFIIELNNIKKSLNFLLDNLCPRIIVREFLGGLFGKYGDGPMIQNNKLLNVKIINNIDNLNILLQKCDIAYSIDDDYYIIESNEEFLKNIGFRYNINKSYKLSIAVTYTRYINYNGVLESPFLWIKRNEIENWFVETENNYISTYNIKIF